MALDPRQGGLFETARHPAPLGPGAHLLPGFAADDLALLDTAKSRVIEFFQPEVKTKEWTSRMHFRIFETDGEDILHLAEIQALAKPAPTPGVPA